MSSVTILRDVAKAYCGDKFEKDTPIWSTCRTKIEDSEKVQDALADAFVEETKGCSEDNVKGCVKAVKDELDSVTERIEEKKDKKAKSKGIGDRRKKAKEAGEGKKTEEGEEADGEKKADGEDKKAEKSETKGYFRLSWTPTTSRYFEQTNVPGGGPNIKRRKVGMWSLLGAEAAAGLLIESPSDKLKFGGVLRLLYRWGSETYKDISNTEQQKTASMVELDIGAEAAYLHRLGDDTEWFGGLAVSGEVMVPFSTDFSVGQSTAVYGQSPDPDASVENAGNYESDLNPLDSWQILIGPTIQKGGFVAAAQLMYIHYNDKQDGSRDLNVTGHGINDSPFGLMFKLGYEW